jgi:hypothetical protein
MGVNTMEGHVVSDLMDSEEQVVVCRPTDHAGGKEVSRGKQVGAAEQVCNLSSTRG